MPGGFCASATEVHQEGLRLPPVKLLRGGETCHDVVDIIMHNIRVPEERMGDMRAQLGALSIGERRLTAFLDKYAEHTVSAVISEMRRPAYGSKGDGFELGAGDWVQVRTPGGGGYGDPRERPRERVRRDLRCGYFSEATAESNYGYVP